MKKILYISLAGLFLLNTGCVDLDLSPTTGLPGSEAIANADDLQMAVNGVFQMMTINRGGHGSDFGFYADCKGGDVYPHGNSGHITPLTQYVITKNHELVDKIYFAMYEPVSFANRAMDAAEDLGLDSDPKIKDLYAQLIAARALLHFDAARMYAQIPTVNGVDMNKAQSGVVIGDAVYPYSHKYTRATLKETYEFIITELEKAIPMLSSTEKNLGGVNAWGAKGVLSRAYLYMGEYAKAYATATDVIANSSYKLFTPENYIPAWKLEGADEFIWEVRASDNISNNAQRNSLGYYSNPNGYGEVGANDNIRDLILALNENDIRRESISERDDAGANKGYYTIKYMGRAGTTVYANNIRIVRLAEMYLIAAEAALKGGSSDANAVKYYNDLRRSRYAEGTYTDVASVTLDDILTERRIELFCENHRLFDLARNNMPVVSYDGTSYAPNANEILLPIPLRETDNNSDLAQNPGY